MIRNSATLKHLSSKSCCVFAMLAFFVAAPVAAQQQPLSKKQEAAAVSEAESFLKKFQLPAEMLAKMDKPSQEIASAVTNINGLLQGNIDVVKNAEGEFNRVIEAIEGAAALNGPNSDFVKKLDELIALANQESVAARNMNAAEAAQQFTAFAKDFEATKAKAAQLHDSSFRQIRQIKQQKEVFILGIKLNNLDQARRNALEGLKLFEQLDTQLKGVREGLPKTPGGAAQ